MPASQLNFGLRYDPRTGLWLCPSCWNGPKTHHCIKSGCECPRERCAGYVHRPKVQFTGEGQQELPMDLKRFTKPGR